MEKLPYLNYNLFVYLLSFFREVLTHEVHNKTTPPHLAKLLVKAMMYKADKEFLSRGGNLSKEEIDHRLSKQEQCLAVIVFLLITPAL